MMFSQGLLWMLRECLFFLGYVSGRSSFPPPLPPDEERKYLERLATGSDETARAVLIEHNLRLVAFVANRYPNTGIEYDDLISIGTIGLIKAISTYDIKNGTPLSGYAAHCIRNEILMAIRARRKVSNETGMYEPVGVDREGNEISLLDVLGTEPDTVTRQVEQNLDMARVYALMRSYLTRQEREVIELRYGLLGAKQLPQREIAQLMGISRSYVSRIEKRAIEKLNRGLERPNN